MAVLLMMGITNIEVPTCQEMNGVCRLGIKMIGTSLFLLVSILNIILHILICVMKRIKTIPVVFVFAPLPRGI